MSQNWHSALISGISSLRWLHDFALPAIAVTDSWDWTQHDEWSQRGLCVKHRSHTSNTLSQQWMQDHGHTTTCDWRDLPVRSVNKNLSALLWWDGCRSRFYSDVLFQQPAGLQAAICWIFICETGIHVRRAKKIYAEDYEYSSFHFSFWMRKKSSKKNTQTGVQVSRITGADICSLCAHPYCFVFFQLLTSQ